MKELHLEAEEVLGPERVVCAVADGLVLIIMSVVQGLHRVGDIVHWRLIAFVGKRPCLSFEPGVVEGLGLPERAECGGGGCGSAQTGKREARYSKRGTSAQEIASLHSALS